MLTKLKSSIISPDSSFLFYGLVFLIILFPLFPLLPGFFFIQGFYMDTYHLAFQLPLGEYTLHYQFKPEPIFLVLRKVSLWILEIWIIVTVLIEGVSFFSKYRIFNLQK